MKKPIKKNSLEYWKARSKRAEKALKQHMKGEVNTINRYMYIHHREVWNEAYLYGWNELLGS